MTDNTDSDDELRVTMQDLAVLGYCSRGARHFLTQRGYDWMTFIQDGITASELETMGDAMAAAAIEQAKRRLAEEGR